MSADRPAAPPVGPTRPGSAAAAVSPASVPRVHTGSFTTHARADLIGWMAVGLVALLFVAVLVRLLPLGARDLGLVGVLSTDEELAGRTVRHMLVTRSLSPNHFFAYGALAHELALAALAPLALFGRVTDTAIIAALRGVSLAGGAGAIVLTAALGWRLGGRAAGVVAALILAVTPEVLDWSVTAHPDTLQLALLSATLLGAVALAERYSVRRVLACGALAGLVFATKYLGMMLVPLLVLAAAAGRARAGTEAPALRAAAADLGLICLSFALAFACTNPYAPAEPARFLSQVRAELDHSRSGHVFAAGDGGWEWLRTAASPALGGPAAAVLGVCGAGLALSRVLRGVRRRVPLPALVDAPALVTLWLAGYLAYLVTQVGYGAPRYALPLLPATAALAGLAVAVGMRRLAGRAGRTAVAGAGAVLLLLLLAAPVWQSHGRFDARVRRAAALEDDPRVVAGRWLAATAPAGAIILRDAYVYLPPQRSGAPVTFGLSRGEVERVRPDYIVVNEDIRGRFRWEVGAERYVDGPAAYRERMATYATLEEGRLDGYHLLRDFGPVQVYGRE